jgi:hypothetical protein
LLSPVVRIDGRQLRAPTLLTTTTTTVVVVVDDDILNDKTPPPLLVTSSIATFHPTSCGSYVSLANSYAQ